MHRQSYTQGGVLEGAQNDTQLQVEARPAEVVVTLELVASAALTLAILVVKGVLGIIHIIDADSQPQVDAVVDIERDVEIVLVYTAPLVRTELAQVGMLTGNVAVEIVVLVGGDVGTSVSTNGRSGETAVGVEKERIAILILGAIIRHLVGERRIDEVAFPAQGGKPTYVGVVEDIAVTPMARGEPVSLGGNDIQLGVTAQVASSTTGTVERLRLVVIEAEVDVAQWSDIAYLGGDDGTDVVEVPTTFVGGQDGACIVCLCTGQRITKGSHHVVAAIDAYTGRIGADDRDIAAEGAHCPTHAHEAGGTVQLLSGDGGGVIYGLCGRAGSRQEGACQGQDSNVHCQDGLKKILFAVGEREIESSPPPIIIAQRLRLPPPPPPEREPPPLRIPPDERNDPPPVEKLERELPDR